MKKLSSPIFHAVFTALFFLFDAVCSFNAIPIAYQVRFRLISPDVPLPPHSSYLALSAMFTVLNLYFLNLSGLYRPVHGTSRIDMVFQIIKSSLFSMGILLALSFFYRDFSYSRLTMAYGAVLAIVLLSLARSILLGVQRWLLRRGHGHKRVLIAGTGGHFDKITNRFLNKPGLGFTLAGYVEEAPDKKLEGLNLLGSINELERIIVLEDIDVVIVTLEPAFHEHMKTVIDLCDRRGLECYLAPDMMEMLVGPRFYEEIWGVPLIRVNGLRIRGFNALVKRASDLLLGTFGFLVLFPFMLIIAAIIKLESPGPIFYMQKRIGMNGKIFWMYKFRSMREDAEGKEGPAWSQHVDPRITRFGNIIRKTSIDELPQLLNVLKGEMSLIGPRPERPYFVEQFEKGIPRYMERHKVKSGMSGWAQVNGLRGDTSVPERLQFDLYYIENWSVLFDLKIILLTVSDVLASAAQTLLKKKAAPQEDHPEDDSNI